MNALNEEERFLYPDSDEGRQQILADYQAIIDEIDAGLTGLFDVRPESGVQVERVPEFMQADGARRLLQPAPLRRLEARHLLRQPARREGRSRSSACVRSPTTRRFRAITSRSPSRRSSRGCRSSAGQSPFTAYVEGLGALRRAAGRARGLPGGSLRSAGLA